ncbi:unnamed protein product, partial [Mesorhabditis spiculigera]
MTWSCSKCTLINHDAMRICEACGEGKQVINGLLPRGLERNLNDFANAITEIFTVTPKPPRPPEPAYNILPRSRSIPARLDDSGQKDGSAGRQIEESIDFNKTTYSSTIRDKEKRDWDEAKNIYDGIMSTCRAINDCFIDPDFPHTDASLGDFHRSGDVVQPGEQIKNLIWLRPDRIFTKDGRRWVWAVFRDPRPSDIEQGSIGDCWLLSAMAILAERPDILEHIIITKEYNPIGVYQIRVCVDGEWRIITVDDFFPCRPENRALAFANGRKNQLWIPLLEKALAKALGSYAKLRAGRTIEGLSMLTGASCEVIHLEEEDACPDTIWVTLLSSREAGYVMGCSCGAGNRRANDAEYKKKGLLTRHAYSILDVRQEGTTRLLRLRNPWGNFVWKGEWSDQWSGWPASMKARLLPTNEPNSGTFWISFSDFMAHFDAVDIARVRAGQGHAELRVPMAIGGPFTGDDRAMRLVVESNTEVCISMFQSGSRTVDDRVDILVCVHEVTPTGHVGELVARSPRKIENFVSTGEVFLRQGHYVVICHSLSTIGVNPLKSKGTLVIHSNRPIFGEQLLCPPQMYTDSLASLVVKEGKIHSSVDGCVPRYLNKDFGGMIMMIDNFHEKCYMQVRLDSNGSENVTSSRQVMLIADSIPPMHRQIIMILSHFESSQSYLIRHHISVRGSRRSGLQDYSSLDPNAFHFPPFQNRDIALLHEYKPVFY